MHVNVLVQLYICARLHEHGKRHTSVTCISLPTISPNHGHHPRNLLKVQAVPGRCAERSSLQDDGAQL